MPIGALSALIATGSLGMFGEAATLSMLALAWSLSLVAAWLFVRRETASRLHRMTGLALSGAARADRTRTATVAGPSSEMLELARLVDGLADEAAEASLKLADALTEKDRLVREVHHRVKNNLQIVSSLISIQARGAENPDVARAYAAIQMRVNALALVHRWLFEGGGDKGVDFAALVHDLCAGLQQSIELAEKINVAFESRIERIYIGQDAAVPLAFFITEVVVAACRLAAMSGTAGTLQIKIELGRAGNFAELVIACEVFKASDAFAISSLGAGARIVQGMARQLRAQFEYDSYNSCYRLKFPHSANR